MMGKTATENAHQNAVAVALDSSQEKRTFSRQSDTLKIQGKMIVARIDHYTS